MLMMNSASLTLKPQMQHHCSCARNAPTAQRDLVAAVSYHICHVWVMHRCTLTLRLRAQLKQAMLKM